MVDFLVAIDRSLFQIINGDIPHSPFLNAFFEFFSGIGNWGFVWIILLFILYLMGEIKSKGKFVGLLFASGLSLVLSEFLLKNLFQRIRPDLTLIGYSFPSSHATLAFAGAYVLSMGHKRLSLFYYLIAVLIGFSRIYLGRHYPSDVVVGSILGFFIGFISVKIAYEIERKSPEKSRKG
ncbi:phosphatase PAP2 family protein [Candidatus Gottesmanbacteria bacterium]|nr:phosphatase PAP2 family protein [Candidatus Gottesmanbacteria bacterium]